MLQNMHNQLTHQATHDELTGLVNRKEFERELARVLGLAKRNKTSHLVVYIDLDQFKVINNSAGNQAGDKLLQEMAALLDARMTGADVVLSRLGGNEFGVLIEGCERDAGVSVTKQLSDQIKRYRFDWKARTTH
ncbi:MAG: diguanylate cyclase [Gammaproteobacteria bacterium]|nr:diguanylate cyclase [Gammaproteobacteria bacterium]